MRYYALVFHTENTVKELKKLKVQKIDEWDDEQHTPTDGQGEFIVAKHRNGGLDEIRLKFVGHLGKFENLDTFPFSNEIASSMNNAANDDTFKTTDFPSAEDAFGTNPSDDLPY